MLIANSVNPQRLLPSRKLIKREVDAGKLGELGLIRVHHWEAPGPMHAGEEQEFPIAVPQQIDLILWLMGKPPNLVYAVERRTQATSNLGRYLQLHLGFAGGAMALLMYSNLPPGTSSYRSLHVIGSAGAAYADDQQNMQLLYQGGQPRGVLAEEAPASDFELVPMTHAWRQVVAVMKGAQDSLSARQAVTLEGH